VGADLAGARTTKDADDTVADIIVWHLEQGDWQPGE